MYKRQAVDEEIVGGNHDLRHGRQKSQLRGKVLPNDPAQGGQVLRASGIQPRRPAHLNEQAPLSPDFQIVVVKGVLHCTRLLHELPHQIVAVAVEADYRILFGQLHHCPQHGQAVRTLLHPVSYTHLIARQLVVSHASPVDTLLGVSAVALIFVIKKFLHTKEDSAIPGAQPPQPPAS